MYSIKALSRITGVPANTLRSWERRYAILGPARDGMGYRSYSAEDAAYLSLIARLTANGHAIGNLAAMPKDQLQKLDAERDQTTLSNGTQQLRRRLFENIRDLDLAAYRTTLSLALITCTPADFAAEVMSPTLQHIGLLWERKEITVAHEHAFTAIARQLIYSAVNIQSPSADKLPLAFACPPGETHELGILLAYYIASSRGHPCTYFGAETPFDALADGVKFAGAKVLVLSVVNPEQFDALDGQLRRLMELLGDETQMWVGSHADQETESPQVIFFDSFSSFDQHLLAQN